MEIKLYGEMTDKPINGNYTKVVKPIYESTTGTLFFCSSSGISVVVKTKFKIKSEKDEFIRVGWKPELNSWMYTSQAKSE